MFRPLTLTLLALTFSAAIAPAQTATARYHLEDVWLLPDVTHPGAPPRLMTGAFRWTYTVGDFENGMAEFEWVDIPWFGSDLNMMIVTIDTGSIELSLNGNYHGLGLDVSLHFVDDLLPNRPVAIDLATSKFHVEQGISYQGSVIDGAVHHDPQLALTMSGTCTQPTFTIEGVTTQRPVALLYAFGTGSQVIPAGYPCAGTVLGLDASTRLGVTLQADAAGLAQLSTTVPPGACGRVYLQALDLSSCGLSPVLPLL